MPDDIGMNDFLNLLQQRRFQNITNGNLPQPMDERPPADLHIDHRHYTDSGPEPTNQVQQMNLAQEPEFPDAAQSVPQTPQFQAPQIGPEETKYREMQKQQPMLSNYHPSRLRSILASIAGGVAGINDPTGGARAQALNQAIRYGPYRQQLEQYNQGLGVQKSAAEQEIGDVSRAATQGHLAAQSAAEVARRQAEEARGRKYEYDISDTAFNRRMQELAVQHPGTNAFHEAKLKDGSLVYLKRDNQTGKLINTDTNLPVEMNAIDVLSDPNKSLKQTVDEKIPAALQASIKAREIVADPKQQGTPAYEAAQEFIKNLSQGKDPKTAFDAVKDKTNEERRARNQPEMSSSELTKLAKQLQPDQKPPQLMVIDPRTNKTVNLRPGDTAPPNFQTPQESSRSEAKKQKETEEMQADKDFVNGYIERGVYTGPDDEALLERFFNATKPSTGFRMNQAQIKLLTDLRSLKSRITAGVQHLTGGTLFDDKQRKEIAGTINNIIDSKMKSNGNTVAPPTSNDGWSVKVVK